MSCAVGVGLRSYLGMPIPVGGLTSGVLNLYSTVHLHLDAQMLAAANLFAARAGVALEAAQRENDLVLALQSSRTIGKAIGLLMERFDLDDHEAFVHLSDLARRSDVELRDVAAHFVKQANDVRHLRNSPPLLREPARDPALVAALPIAPPPAGANRDGVKTGVPDAQGASSALS
jgi:GAF domain-containing protein